jgi:hypothetical protein
VLGVVLARARRPEADLCGRLLEGSVGPRGQRGTSASPTHPVEEDPDPIRFIGISKDGRALGALPGAPGVAISRYHGPGDSDRAGPLVWLGDLRPRPSIRKPRALNEPLKSVPLDKEEPVHGSAACWARRESLPLGGPSRPTHKGKEPIVHRWQNRSSTKSVLWAIRCQKRADQALSQS